VNVIVVLVTAKLHVDAPVVFTSVHVQIGGLAYGCLKVYCVPPTPAQVLPIVHCPARSVFVGAPLVGARPVAIPVGKRLGVFVSVVTRFTNPPPALLHEYTETTGLCKVIPLISSCTVGNVTPLKFCTFSITKSVRAG